MLESNADFKPLKQLKLTVEFLTPKLSIMTNALIRYHTSIRMFVLLIPFSIEILKYI